MGSRTSRPLAPPSISGPPHLPFDVYLEIVRHLSPSSAQNRQTLLALALCCRTLREPSQRALFGALRYKDLDVDVITTDSVSLARTLKRHLRFLHAVVDSPDRLALYVTSYSQHALALDPKLQSTGQALKLAHTQMRVQIWSLTENAFPLMVNLKNLYFATSVHHPSAPKILARSTFQLETFFWIGIGSEETLFSTFLPTQRGLLHLDINSDTSNDKPALPDGLCPSLTSVACALSDLAEISAQRPVVALHVANSTADVVRPPRADMMDAVERDRYISALKRLQYLRLSTLPQFQRFTSGVTLHGVTTLELRIWQVEDIDLLAQFPDLRILQLWDHYPSQADTLIRRDTAHRAFSQCLWLQAVLIMSSVPHSGQAWRFARQCGGINKELVSIYNHIDSVWWKI